MADDENDFEEEQQQEEEEAELQPAEQPQPAPAAPVTLAAKRSFIQAFRVLSDIERARLNQDGEAAYALELATYQEYLEDVLSHDALRAVERLTGSGWRDHLFTSDSQIVFFYRSLQAYRDAEGGTLTEAVTEFNRIYDQQNDTELAGRISPDLVLLSMTETSMLAKFTAFFNNVDIAMVVTAADALATRIEYKGFDPMKMFTLLCQFADNNFVPMLVDMFALVTLGLKRGTSMTKMIDSMADTMKVRYNALKDKYHIQDKVINNESVTIGRIMQVFAPFTVMISSGDEFELPIDCDFVVNKDTPQERVVHFPKICRSSALIALLPTSLSNEERIAVCGTIAYYQTLYSQLVNYVPNKKWKAGLKKSYRYILAVQPTIFSFSNSDKANFVAEIGLNERLGDCKDVTQHMKELYHRNAVIRPKLSQAVPLSELVGNEADEEE